MSRKNGSHATQVERRTRQRSAIELLGQGETQTSIAKALNISRVTLWRDLCEVEALIKAELSEDYRKKLLGDLHKLRSVVASGRISDGRKVELMLAILDREVKLGPKMDLNKDSGDTNTTRITVNYVGSDVVDQVVAEAESRRRLETAKAEGERQRSVNKAIVMETPLLEGKVKP
jgi:hypothetical protein